MPIGSLLQNRHGAHGTHPFEHPFPESDWKEFGAFCFCDKYPLPRGVQRFFGPSCSKTGIVHSFIREVFTFAHCSSGPIGILFPMMSEGA